VALGSTAAATTTISSLSAVIDSLEYYHFFFQSPTVSRYAGRDITVLVLGDALEPLKPVGGQFEDIHWWEPVVALPAPLWKEG
jgi:hypothetical protein